MANERTIVLTAIFKDSATQGVVSMNAAFQVSNQRLQALATTARTSLPQATTAIQGVSSASLSLTRNLDPTVNLVEQFAQRLGDLHRAGGLPHDLPSDLAAVKEQFGLSTREAEAYVRALQAVRTQTINLDRAIAREASGLGRTPWQEYSRQLQLIQSQASQFLPMLNNQVGQAASSLGLITGASGMATLGVAALAAAGFELIKILAQLGAQGLISASQMETALASISTIKPEIDASRLDQQLTEISERIPRSARALAEGVYDIFSSMEVTQEEAAQLAETAAKGAVAAQADFATFSRATMGVLNSYGLAAKDASRVSDIFFGIVNKGVINGQELATGLGKVAPAAKNLGVELEELGALIVGVTKEGGNADENLTKLFNLLNQLSTTSARQALTDIGVATADAKGNFRSVIDIVTDLKTKLSSMPEAVKAAKLNEIFPEVRAAAGATVLMNQLDTMVDAHRMLKTEVGATDAAYEKFTGTIEFQAGVIKNKWDNSLREAATERLPAIERGAGVFERLIGPITAAGTALADPLLRNLEGVADVIEFFGGSSDEAGAEWANNLIGHVGEGTQQTLDMIEEMNRQAEAQAWALALIGEAGGEGYGQGTANKIEETTPGIAEKIGNILELADVSDIMGATGLFGGQTYGGQMASGIEGIIPRISAAVNSILRLVDVAKRAVNEARALAGLTSIAPTRKGREDAHDRDTYREPEWEAALRKRVESGEDSAADIEGMRQTHHSGPGGPAPSTSITKQWENLESLRKQFESKYGYDPTTGTPVAGKSSKKGGGKGSKSDADKMQSAQEEFNKARAKYESDLKELELTGKLKTAQDELSAAQDRAKSIADGYASVQKFVKDSIENTKDAMAEATKQLRADLAAEEQALSDMRAKNSEDLHKLDFDIHMVTETIRKLKEAGQNALEPLQAEAKRASAVLSKLQKDGAAVREAFAKAMRPLQDALYDVGQRRQATMDPLFKNIEELQDRLYDLGKAEKEALTPFDDAMYEGNLALKQAQKHVEAVATSFDEKLIPLTKQLTALQREQEQIDRSKSLRDMAIGVANLDAQIKNAAPGSRGWNELIRKREEEQGKLNRTQKQYSLEDQIKAIEAAKSAAVEAAEAQVKAQQKVLDQMAEHREEIRRSFELERRMLEDRLAAEQRAAELTERNFAREEEIINRQMALQTRQEELFDREQHDKEVAAQAEAERAAEAVVSEQEKQAALLAPHEAELARLQALRDKKAWEAGEAERAAQRNIDAKLRQITETEEPYKAEIARLEAVQKMLGKNSELDEASAQDAVKHARVRAEAARDALDLFRGREKEADIATRWSEAQKKYAEAVGSLAESAPKVQDLDTQAKNAAISTAAAGTAVVGVANALKNDFGPAVAGLTSKASPELTEFWRLWMQHFGTPNQETTGYIAQLMGTHNTQGFWAYLESNARLGLGGDGYRGVWMQELQILFEAVAGKFEEEKPALDTATKDFGTDLLGGVALGFADELARKHLADAIVAACQAAIEEAKKQLGIASPSKFSGRELGLPLMQGIPVAFAEAAPAAGAQMGRTLRGMVGGLGVGLGVGSMPMFARGSMPVAVGSGFGGGGFIDQSTNHYRLDIPTTVQDLRGITAQEWASIYKKMREGERIFKGQTGRY